MNHTLNYKDVISWILALIFVVLGIMNLVLVHAVPGTFYILFSFIYYPPFNSILKKKLGFMIPYYLKIILALLLLWATLAVGDLAEMYGL